MTVPGGHISPRERRALVALALVPGVGPGRIRALVARLGSAADVLAAPASALAQVPGIGAGTARAIAAADLDAEVDAQFESAERVGATLLTAWDDGFPALLRQIYDPPAFLWVRGDVRADDDRAVAIVGTRRATAYGTRIARALAAALAERGVTVVSGLAYGIDAAAHRGALDAGGRTIGVLGSGADRIYPASNARLARDMIASGAVVSEYVMGAAPDAPNFPRRNRIVSGLALGVVVVEAFEKGGALITARTAIEQNREVFAVPSAVESRAGVGANRLIQRGHAKLVVDVDDILDELRLDDLPAAFVAREEPPAPALAGPEQAIFEALGAEPIHIDLLCQRTGIEPSTLLVHLLGLEFKGLVVQLAGKQFFRSGAATA